MNSLCCHHWTNQPSINQSSDPTYRTETFVLPLLALYSTISAYADQLILFVASTGNCHTSVAKVLGIKVDVCAITTPNCCPLVPEEGRKLRLFTVRAGTYNIHPTRAMGWMTTYCKYRQRLLHYGTASALRGSSIQSIKWLLISAVGGMGEKTKLQDGVDGILLISLLKFIKQHISLLYLSKSEVLCKCEDMHEECVMLLKLRL